ncbi:hypothetical protein HYG86_01385 [Alkalicella caledoniensis]|uniref:WD40 repeat domain-containing protein n=1 Tax=Alkalicella caledoniensis TaxID=2731377 RepID=A0A7G9W4A1_ALKCA|nr:hypothetical protein [Alkalicella caledoniensis]QNO13513.1 hypothetical protein HYG86_01385 [Alkalicella caledoniensis]
MKSNLPSYNKLLSPDETVLVNIGKYVSLYAIDDSGLNELKRFNTLRNPSRAALSSDGKMLAYSNTSGHIAVHDIETGNLLVKSKCLSKEGYSLYFINNDSQLISSDWFGNIFVLDIKSAKITLLNSFPFHNATNLVPISNNSFMVLGSISTGETVAYDFLIQKDTGTFEKLFSSYPYRLETTSFACFKNEVYFYGDNINNSSDKWLDDDIAENALFSYNMSAKELHSIICIQELLGINCSLNSEYGYFTTICISSNKQYILIGYSKSIIIVDLLSKKHITTIKTKYLNSLHLVKSDTKVIIGTWNDIQIVDFIELCQLNSL